MTLSTFKTFLKVNKVKIQDKNIVNVFIDESCDMVNIELNGKSVGFGNFGDIYDGCTGKETGFEYDGYEDLVEKINYHITKIMKKECAINEIEWECEY